MYEAAVIPGNALLKAELLRQNVRDTSFVNSAEGSVPALGAGMEAVIKDRAANNQPANVYLKEREFSGSLPSRMKQGWDKGTAGNYLVAGEPDAYQVNYNPKADKAFLAHELGHVASDRTKTGNIVRTLRDNPNLGRALRQASYLAPGAMAALTPGDDDLAASIGLGLAASAPALLDEGFATKHGLDIMKRAGMPATPGQRGRLAGAYLSYLAAPIATAVAANYAGNLMDDELVGPGPDQTPSTLMP